MDRSILGGCLLLIMFCVTLDNTATTIEEEIWRTVLLAAVPCADSCDGKAFIALAVKGIKIIDMPNILMAYKTVIKRREVFSFRNTNGKVAAAKMVKPNNAR